jgi:hypothetical protein
MVRLDSVKILLPNECLNWVSDRGIDELNKRGGSGDVIKDKTNFTNTGIRGLKNIHIDRLRHTTTIEMSSKILEGNYIEGINKNTITEAIEKINCTNLVRLDLNKVLDSGSFLKIDITDNIKLDNQKKGKLLYRTLANIPLAQKYHTDFWKTNSNLGVVWQGTQKTKKDRFIIYDKSIELRKDKSLKNSGYCNKVLTDFFGVNRFEQNITSLKDIRHYYQNTGITEVLNSNTKANYLKFSKMVNRNTDIDLRLFGYFEGMKFFEIRSFMGDKGICEMFQFDWHRIEMFVRTHNESNYRRFLPSLKKVYNMLNVENKESDFGLIEEIKQKLYA